MHLANLKVYNFRKYGSTKQQDKDFIPGLDLTFNTHMNLLVGENDAGKTAIIDAIKFVIGTQSGDWLRLYKEDFHINKTGIRADWLIIECTFKGFTSTEAASFIEWVVLDEDNNYCLQLKLTGRYSTTDQATTHILYDIRAGIGEDLVILPAEARERLRATYLRPLRDAEAELAPKKGSRLSQILSAYRVFRKEGKHKLQEIMDAANTEIDKYFKEDEGKEVLDTINNDYLVAFSLSENLLSSQFKFTDNDLKRILEKLELKIKGSKDTDSEYLGLGSNNLLFIATELLLLKKEEYPGLKIVMIEEIEAHLHPQSQLNLITFLTDICNTLDFQLILTTHSNTLTSKVNIENLILCKNGQAFSFRQNETKLEHGDYNFLTRFLDDTKANLFFANGVIIVEGLSENLIIPALAKYIGYPLEKYGISIVNVNSTALLRYSKIFQRQDGKPIGIPVSCITDRDIPPIIAKTLGLIKSTRQTSESMTDQEIATAVATKNKLSGGVVRTFVSPVWTLEYDIALSCFRNLMHQAINLSMQSKDMEKALTPEERSETIRKADDEIAEWQTAGVSELEIAAKIYAPLATRQTSKSVSAQFFADLISTHKTKTPFADDLIENDSHLRYLVDAISYAAGKTTNKK